MELWHIQLSFMHKHMHKRLGGQFETFGNLIYYFTSKSELFLVYSLVFYQKNGELKNISYLALSTEIRLPVSYCKALNKLLLSSKAFVSINCSRLLRCDANQSQYLNKLNWAVIDVEAVTFFCCSLPLFHRSTEFYIIYLIIIIHFSRTTR